MADYYLGIAVRREVSLGRNEASLPPVAAAQTSRSPADRGPPRRLALGRSFGALLDAAGAGRLMIGAHEPFAGLGWAQLGLWNVGGLAVPLGILADAPVSVSVALLAALALFAAGARGTEAGISGWRVAYYGVVVLLAASVIVDSAWPTLRRAGGSDHGTR